MTLRLSGGRRLQSPPGETARPTAARVRQAVINLLAADLPGCRWLDLCCGSGVMACEALQRGASEVVAIERDRRVVLVARANLEAVAAGMGAPRPLVRVIQADARRWLVDQAPLKAGDVVVVESETPRFGGGLLGMEPLPETAAAIPAGRSVREPRLTGAAAVGKPGLRERPFDMIYCDPPWPLGLHVPLSEAVALGGWIRPGGTLVWECPSGQVPSAPAGWCVRDQRRYGGSTVVLLEPV